MTDSPKEIVARFVEERLAGDLDKLRNFCFAELKGTGYGKCPGKSGFDCDNTLLANAIYVLLWGGGRKVFPELTLDKLGSGGKFPFRGDTMNSFRTVLGAGNFDSTVLLWKEYGMDEKVEAFFLKYHTIGNFVVLPTSSGNRMDTFNTYRGDLWGWHDFFDRFLVELDKVLRGSEDASADLRAIVECNRDAFQERQLPELANALFLDDYMDEKNAAPLPLFAPYSTSTEKRFPKKIADEAYRNFAYSYIDKATAIIDKRATAICDRLSRLL